jgi:hypothetical protein
MSDLGWLYGKSWYDRTQNRQLESLSDQLDRQRGEARRLKSQLSSVRGDLEQRLTRMTRAFDAFVELSDVRDELRAYQPAVEARHRARRVLSRLIGTAGSADRLPSPADPASELPGYWLPSALAGLVATVRGDDATAESELATARRDDAPRTDLFLCLALLLIERADQAADLLPGLLDLRADQPVTRAQRELWLAAGDGRFGELGRAVVTDRLAALVAGLPGDTRATQVAAWRSVVEGLGGSLPAIPAIPAFPRPAEPPVGLVAPIRAASRLAALAEWYRQAVAEPGPGPDPGLGEQLAPSDHDPPDPIPALLQELVDEGAPEEQPLLTRVAELRLVVEADGGDPSAAPARWHAPVDTPMALILADARSSRPGRRAVAATAATPLLEAVADELAATAVGPLPDETDVRMGGHTISYRSMGVDQTTVATARDATLASPPPPGRRVPAIGLAFALAGVVAMVCVAAGAVGLGVVLGLGFGSTGTWLLFDAHQARRAWEAEEERRRSEWQRLERRISEVGAALVELRAQASGAPEDATAARARLGEQAAAAATATSRTTPSTLRS